MTESKATPFLADFFGQKQFSCQSFDGCEREDIREKGNRKPSSLKTSMSPTFL